MEDISTQRDRTETKPVPFIARFLATGFFSGYSPMIPGTAGSLVGLAIYAIPTFHDSIVLLIASIAFFFLGVITSSPMEQRYGTDPSIVVIDEIVGMWLSLLFLPVRIPIAVIAFVCFRIFDTIKPPPVRKLERIGGGWGIMLDDVGAAIYTNLVVQILRFVLPGLA